MNVVTRGVKNSLRSPVRSGAIVLMFAISIALVLSMLVARSSVLSKIDEVKSSAGTSVTIRPAGTMGDMGGGDPLTSEQLETIENTTHIESTVLTLTDQLSSDDTSLESSLEFGGIGQGKRDSSSSSSSSDGQSSTDTDTDSDSSSSDSSAPSDSSMPSMTPSITLTGTTDPNSVSTSGEDLTIESGSTIDGTSADYVALIGSSVAEENDLEVGDTFTAYDATFIVSGIYTTDNTFQDSGVIIPLETLQIITDQADVVSSIVAKVDSSDNVSTVVSSLESSLGDDADITSDIEQAEESVSSLSGIASLAFAGVVAASIAGGIIILLAMIMVVRERRREIGVMKAIGGTNKKVVGQFIVEGMTITVIGTFIGMIVGVLVSGPMTTSLVSSQSSSSSSSQQVSRGGGGGSADMGDSSSAGSDSATSDTDSSDSSSDSSSSTRGGGMGMMGSDGIVGKGLEQVQNNVTQINAALTPSIIAAALGLTIFIALIGTAIPAWITTRIRPAEVLRAD